MKAHLSLFPFLAAVLVPQAKAIEQIIVPWDYEWSYLHPMGTDPAIADEDFNSTWFLKAADFPTGYNGPAFGAGTTGDPFDPGTFDSGTGPGPIGYDVMDYFNTGGEFSAFNTLLTRPLTTAEGSDTGDRRFAAYFRTTFTTAQVYTAPRFRMLVDDGALIYLDGVLIARVNNATNTETYTSFGQDTTATLNETFASANNESAIQSFSLAATGTSPTADSVVIVAIPTIAPGEHTLAVSLRNNAATSSDLGMALELRGDDTGIVAAVSNVQRQANGAGFADDTFTFDVTVTANNLAGPSTWTSNNPAGNGPTGGAYGTPVTFTFPAQLDPGTVGTAAITFADSADPSIVFAINVTAPPPAAGAPLVLAAATPQHELNFEEPPIGAGSQVRSIYNTEMGFTSNGVIWDDEAVNAENDGTKALRLSNAVFEMTSEAIGLDPAVKGIRAAVSLRTFTTTATGFESNDVLRVVVEGSADGTAWHELGNIAPQLSGHTDAGEGGWPPNPEGLDQLLNKIGTGVPGNTGDINIIGAGPYFNFGRTALAPQAGDAFVRIRIYVPNPPDGVTARAALSNSENIFVDKLLLAVGIDPLADADSDGLTNGFEDFAGSDPNNTASAYRVTTAFSETPATPGSTRLSVTFPESNFRTYVLEGSDDMVTWTTSAFYFGTSAGANITQTEDSVSTRRFYRATVRY